jgi:hypothetical protein
MLRACQAQFSTSFSPLREEDLLSFFLFVENTHVGRSGLWVDHSCAQCEGLIEPWQTLRCLLLQK